MTGRCQLQRFLLEVRCWHTSLFFFIFKIFVFFQQRMDALCRIIDVLGGYIVVDTVDDGSQELCHGCFHIVGSGQKLWCANTNYATMITSPQYHRTKLKFIQLSVISEDQLLAVVVAEGNVVKNKVIPISHGLDNETILKLNILLNTSLNGLTMEEINLSTIAKLKEQAGIHSEVINSVLDAVAEAIQMDDDLEVYTSGTTNFSSTRSWRTARRPALSSVPLRISSSSQASWKT